MQPEPFTIAIPEADLADMRARIASTRWAPDIGNEDWRYGVERGWLEDMARYWQRDYDWRAVETGINRYSQYMVTIDGVPLHFLHVKGKGPNPTPLLLLHGWPWTFADYLDMIGPLTDPAAHGGDPADSFDLVIPSLPGHGFSMPLTRTGIDVPTHVALFTKLMRDVLGYDRFALAGGDWGSTIICMLAHTHPEAVIGLVSAIPYFPGLDLAKVTPQDYAEDEQWMLERQAESMPTAMSHFAVQSVDPQTLAYALGDSPVGTAAWLWERRRLWSDCGGDLLSVHSRDFLCTLASISWLTRSIGSSLRIYWEHVRAGGLPFRPLHDRQPAIEVPCCYAIAPAEVVFVPRALAEKGTDLRRWTVLPKGGHFSMAEQPDLMAREMRGFFGDLRKGRLDRDSA